MRAAAQIVADIRQAGGEPSDAWDTLFQSKRVGGTLLAECLFQLHHAGDYELAIEGMQSAIRNNHAQAWMYDALALEMTAAGRPAGEISRVLESRVDFSSGDSRQMLVTAAMLSRFKAWPAALRVCRDVTEQDPSSPEAWMLARSIADRAADNEARVWSRCGILRHVWAMDYEVAHQEARHVLTTMIEDLERSGLPDAAADIRERFDAANTVDLRIIVRWVGPADLNLSMTEPGGTTCDLGHRFTAAGGLLAHDESGNLQDKAGRHYEEYICHTAVAGEYTATVRFVFGDVVAGRAVLEVIQHEHTPQETKTVTTIPLAREDVSVPIQLATGRRAATVEK